MKGSLSENANWALVGVSVLFGVNAVYYLLYLALTLPCLLACAPWWECQD